MANKPGDANFFPDVPEFPSMGTFQPVYGKFDLTTYIQGASDYEIMAFLVGKYNACLEAYGNITKLSTDTITACKQLQDWINSWFDNLDVQEELNKKIDSMVQDGSFGRLLHQTFDAQINQQTTDAVTAWLIANVTPTGSAVVVDKSLSIEGAAADAKVTGEVKDIANYAYNKISITKTASNKDTVDPNPGSEGTSIPNQSAYGGYVQANVTAGETILLTGAKFSWLMFFKDSRTPTGLVSKKNYTDAEKIIAIVPDTANIVVCDGIGVNNGMENAVVRNNTNFAVVGDITSIEDNINAKISITKTASNKDTVDPNPGSEGTSIPNQSAYGGYVQANVTAGETILLTGAKFSWLMFFKDSRTPTGLVSKKNYTDAEKIIAIVPDTANIVVCDGIGVNNGMENAVVRNNTNFAVVGDITSIEDNIYIAIGDSITAGSGASEYGNNYYWITRTALRDAQLIDNSYNSSIAGATANTITNMSIGNLYTTSDFTIPATGTSIGFTLSSSINSPANIPQGNPYVIQGINGTIDYVNGNYTFTREISGDALTVKSGTQVVSHGAATTKLNKFCSIFIGTNNRSSDELSVIENINSIVKTFKHKTAILTPYVGELATQDFEQLVIKNFGFNVIPLFNYMSNYSVGDAIKRGYLTGGVQENWKALLTTDGTHPNDAGHHLIADLLIEKLNNL